MTKINGNDIYRNSQLYYVRITLIILIGIVTLVFLIYSNFLLLNAHAQAPDFSPDTDFAPLQPSPQILEPSLNETMEVQQQLQQQMQTISNLSSQDIQQEQQRELLDIKRSEQELQQNQKLLPQLSLQRGQQMLINQLQTLQQLISLPPDQQQKVLKNMQQLLMPRQGLQ
jgi:hypothetical protein